MKSFTLATKDILSLVQYLEAVEARDLEETKICTKTLHDLEDSVRAFLAKRGQLQTEFSTKYSATKAGFSEEYRAALNIPEEGERHTRLTNLQERYTLETQAVERAYFDKIEALNEDAEKEAKAETSDEKFTYLFDKLKENGAGFWKEKKTFIHIMETLDAIK